MKSAGSMARGWMLRTGGLVAAALMAVSLVGCSDSGAGTPTAGQSTPNPFPLEVPATMAGELCRGSGAAGDWTIACDGVVAADSGYDITIQCEGEGFLSYAVTSDTGESLTSGRIGCGVAFRNTVVTAGKLKAGQKVQLSVTPSGEVTAGIAVVFPVA